MVLNLFVLVFVLALTFLHSMFGLFSGVVNVFCAITALCVAFGFMEPVNDLLSSSVGMPTIYSEPTALVALFVVTLGVLRYLADTFVRGNVRVPMYLDWIGGGIAGFVHTEICVGVMVIGFLMLPWGGRVMMFQPLERKLDASNEEVMDDTTRHVAFERRHLWMRSDEFAAGLFKMISGGSLRGSTAFADMYPDYCEWLAWTGNQVQRESLPTPFRSATEDGYKNGVAVERWWEEKGAIGSDDVRYRKLAPAKEREKPPYDSFELRSHEGKLLGVRVKLNANSADRADTGAAHRFRPTNFRLVGVLAGDDPNAPGEPVQVAPVAIGGADNNVPDKVRVVDPDNNFSMGATGNEQVDLYFDVKKEFVPHFVEYRRRARAAVQRDRFKAEVPERLVAGGAAKPEGDKGKATGLG